MKEPSDLERAFMHYWRLLASDLPEPVREYAGLKPRRFRFDFAFVEEKIAIECQGGIWTHGRHSRGNGQTADYIKHNLATEAGWKLIYVTNTMLRDNPQHIVDILRILINNAHEPALRRGDGPRGIAKSRKLG